MIGELFLAGMTIVVPVNGSYEESQSFKMQPVAQYSSTGFSNFLNNELYFADKGNTYALMTPNSSVPYNNVNDKAQKALSKFKSELKDLTIDFDERTDYFDFLSRLRNSEDYDNFLRLAALDKNINACNAICIFLSQKEHTFIYAEEENFILNMLKSGNLKLQEFALSALLNWETINDLQELNNIKINNKYLQEDLEAFKKTKVK